MQINRCMQEDLEGQIERYVPFAGASAHCYDVMLYSDKEILAL